jgi:hypothetical protein
MQHQHRHSAASQQNHLLIAKPQVPRQTRREPKKEAAQAPPAITPAFTGLTRKSAALVTTSAPPSSAESEDDAGDDGHDDSFSAFAPSSGSVSQSAPMYSPWLKPNHMLSPVLERTIDSAASTPNQAAQQRQQQQQQAQGNDSASQSINRPFFTDLQDSAAPSVAHSPLRPQGASTRMQEVEEKSQSHDGRRNLLSELRQSLEQQPIGSSPNSQQAHVSSLPAPTVQNFMSLMAQVLSQLGERDGLAAKEAQFKSSTAASLAAASAQLKVMALRIEDTERETRAVKAAAEQQQVEHERALSTVHQQVRMLEHRIEQMTQTQGQRAPAAFAQQQQHQAPGSVAHQPYDPSLYNSHARAMPPTSSASSSFSTTRAPSPPRPIIINHATSSVSVSMPRSSPPPSSAGAPATMRASTSSSLLSPPSSQLNGSRLSEVNVTVQGEHLKQAPGRGQSVVPVPVVASHKVAWQTYQQQQQQPATAIQQHQQHMQQMQGQTQAQQRPHPHARAPSPARSLPSHPPSSSASNHLRVAAPVPFHSRMVSQSQDRSDAADEFHEDEEEEEHKYDAHDAEDDDDDEQPRTSLASQQPFAPFSPGSEQDEEEARQFAVQAARMRATQATFGQGRRQ